MPQGYITKVEGEFGTITCGEKTFRFKRWGLCPEAAGRFPRVGAYVQFRDITDPIRGDYITDVRVITAPQALPTGRFENVYKDAPEKPKAGIDRIERDGSGREPLETALAREEAEAQK